MQSFTTHLPALASSLREAREWARPKLQAWDLGGIAEEADLLLSELVSNVVRHVREPMFLCLSRQEESVRVEVGDPSSDAPVLQDPGPDREGGRGMLLIAAVAARWGTDMHPDDGKTVWFELDVDPGVAPQ